MILEHVILPVRADRSAEFEEAFAEARLLVEASAGFRGLSLTRGIEHPETYLLLIEWDSLDAHETGFRGSPAYARWSELLHGFYDPFPKVTHFGSRTPRARDIARAAGESGGACAPARDG